MDRRENPDRTPVWTAKRPARILFGRHPKSNTPDGGPSPAIVREVVTLARWSAAGADERAELLQPRPGAAARFNRQDTDSIDWARWSWNPVTGCLHGCPYCYARDIAVRFYAPDVAFSPALYPDRLTAPVNTPRPRPRGGSADRQADRNVFTGSMADLFGKWVPDEWIAAVMRAVAASPQWTFLFLTKFPARLAELSFPANCWLGTSVDRQATVARAEKSFARLRAAGWGGVCWLSCEPMLEPLTFARLDLFDWVVMGGSSKSTQTPAFYPPSTWVEGLLTQCRDLGIPVYMKANLTADWGDRDRVREYPHAEVPPLWKAVTP